jgi:hypothetical protein
MHRFRIQDLAMLEKHPTSPSNLADKLGELLSHSISTGVRVEKVDATTGEYRVTLRGILDQDEGLPEW